MNSLDRYLGYERHVVDRCRDVAPTALHQAFDIGHGTLHETIVHIIGNLLLHVLTHTTVHRSELQHMLQWLGLQDLIEGDALSGEGRPQQHPGSCAGTQQEER